MRISRDTEIQCLTPEAAGAVLKAAEATSPGCAIGFAVAIFGGVRLRELEKLTWENIGETHIEITAQVTKRHARRLIPISDEAREDADRLQRGNDLGNLRAQSLFHSNSSLGQRPILQLVFHVRI